MGRGTKGQWCTVQKGLSGRTFWWGLSVARSARFSCKAIQTDLLESPLLLHTRLLHCQRLSKKAKIITNYLETALWFKRGVQLDQPFLKSLCVVVDSRRCPPWCYDQKAREGCGCLWDAFGGSRGKLRESDRKIAGKIFPDRAMLQILGLQAPGKANLPRTLGRHSRVLVPTLRVGCFLKSTVPAFSSFSDMRARELHKLILTRNSCVTDALCNWEICSHKVIMFGSVVLEDFPLHVTCCMSWLPNGIFVAVLPPFLDSKHSCNVSPCCAARCRAARVAVDFLSFVSYGSSIALHPPPCRRVKQVQCGKLLYNPIERHFLEASRQVEGMCHFTSEPLKSLPYFCSAKTLKMTHFGQKKVHGFPVRKPIGHIVPISRTYPPP